jgi:hypothetical protein
MKAFFRFVRVAALFILFAINYSFADRAGFFLDDSVSEQSMTYKSYDNLIVIPVTINGGLQVNLILDTGCRNLVLFGNTFQDQLELQPGRIVSFSGMGEGKQVNGSLSLDNTVRFGNITGERIPIVVVSSRSIFKRFPNVDGIIGYEIFSRFEVEIVPSLRRITFRPAHNSPVREGYDIIPLTVDESRPMIHSLLVIDGQEVEGNLLIDTGSSKCILVKSKDSEMLERHKHQTLGEGLNGQIAGWSTQDSNLTIGTHQMRGVEAGVIYSPWHEYASIGMGALKDYAIVLNYVRSFAAIKRLS